MSCFEIIDPRFKALIDPVAFLETIHTGNRWAEGPVWFGDLRCLVWSDIPNSRMLRWDRRKRTCVLVPQADTERERQYA